jgi:hypothetical protein
LILSLKKSFHYTMYVLEKNVSRRLNGGLYQKMLYLHFGIY